MEKKAPDRRIQRTRRLLQDALVALILEQGYEAVTVQDIIDRANVGRATFYAHFQGKEELLFSQFEVLLPEFEQRMAMRAGSDPWEVILVMFQYAQDQAQLYQALARKQGDNVMVAHASTYLRALLRDHLRPVYEAGKEPQVPLEVLTHYLVSTLMALFTWWLDHDLPYPAERMYGMYRQLTEPGVDKVLRRPG